jgi:hypothetical protein
MSVTEDSNKNTVGIVRVPVEIRTPHDLIEYDIVACTAVSRQRLGKHVPMATDTNVTVEILLKTVFSTWSVQKGYKEDS